MTIPQKCHFSSRILSPRSFKFSKLIIILPLFQPYIVKWFPKFLIFKKQFLFWTINSFYRKSINVMQYYDILYIPVLRFRCFVSELIGCALNKDGHRCRMMNSKGFLRINSIKERINEIMMRWRVSLMECKLNQISFIDKWDRCSRQET